MCKYKVSWFGKQGQHCGASAACSPAPLSSQASGALFCRLASRSTSAKFTLGQLSQMCKPIPLMLCTWSSSLEDLDLQFISSPQDSKAQSTQTASILSPQKGTILFLFFPGSRRPQTYPSYGGGQPGLEQTTKTQKYQHVMEAAICKNWPSQLFWQRTRLTSICLASQSRMGLRCSPARARSSQGAIPAPPQSQLLQGLHNKCASLTPEVEPECIYSTSSALKETESFEHTNVNIFSLSIFIHSQQRCPGKAVLQHTGGNPAPPGSPNLQGPLQHPRGTAAH